MRILNAYETVPNINNESVKYLFVTVADVGNPKEFDDLLSGTVVCGSTTYVGYSRVTSYKYITAKNQLGLYMMNSQLGISDVLKWNTKDGVCEEWEFGELLGLANAMKSEAQPLVIRQQEAETKIKAAVSYEEIETILSEFV